VKDSTGLVTVMHTVASRLKADSRRKRVVKSGESGRLLIWLASVPRVRGNTL